MLSINADSETSLNASFRERTPLLTGTSRILMSPGLVLQQRQLKREGSFLKENSLNLAEPSEESASRLLLSVPKEDVHIFSFDVHQSPFQLSEDKLPPGIQARSQTSRRVWNAMAVTSREHFYYFLLYGDVLQEMVLAKQCLDSAKLRCDLTNKETEALEKFEMLVNNKKSSHLVYFYLCIRDEVMLWKTISEIGRVIADGIQRPAVTLVGFCDSEIEKDRMVALINSRKHQSLNVALSVRPITKVKIEDLLLKFRKIQTTFH
jgi:hypothetical protein